MGAIAPIDFEKCLFAPIDFDKKAYCDHHFLSLMGANLLFITSLHPSIKDPKEGPDIRIPNDQDEYKIEVIVYLQLSSRLHTYQIGD